MKQAIKTERIGIAVGDVITTSYNTGPFKVVSVSEPVLFYRNVREIEIFSQPIIYLVLKDLREGLANNSPSYIGGIRQNGSRWFTAMNDEIFVEKQGASQPDLFQEITEYPFEKGCDYRAGVGKVWRCETCEKDFNTENKVGLPNLCPVCVKNRTPMPVTIPIFYFEFTKQDPFLPHPSCFNVSLNFEEYKPCLN